MKVEEWMDNTEEYRIQIKHTYTKHLNILYFFFTSITLIFTTIIKSNAIFKSVFFMFYSIYSLDLDDFT